MGVAIFKRMVSGKKSPEQEHTRELGQGPCPDPCLLCWRSSKRPGCLEGGREGKAGGSEGQALEDLEAIVKALAFMLARRLWAPLNFFNRKVTLSVLEY